jgi:hypothetical protein
MGNLGAWLCLDIVLVYVLFGAVNLVLSLSCYKLACHHFPTLAEYFMYSHLLCFYFCCYALLLTR